MYILCSIATHGQKPSHLASGKQPIILQLSKFTGDWPMRLVLRERVRRHQLNNLIGLFRRGITEKIVQKEYGITVWVESTYTIN